MVLDADDCDAARLKDQPVTAPVHQGRRILPEDQAPAQAWTENEDERHGETSPGESRKLLPPAPPKKSRLQAGVTLGVHPQTKYTKCPQFAKHQKKSKLQDFQKRKDKWIALLRPPYFILIMIMIIVCIHVWGSEYLRKQLEWSPGAWWQEPWRLFTYGFVHANGLHLALNALVAFAVGWALEREQGWWRVVAVWCGGLAAGALGAGALQPKVRVVGASAAVYALLTSHIANVCLRFGHIPLWWFRPLSVLVLGTSEGCWALMRSSPAMSPPSAAHAHPAAYEQHVAWGAHALGAAVGVPLGFIVFTGENKGSRYMIVCRIVSGILLAAGVVLASVNYACWYDIDQT